ncbi:MAG: Rho termination factor N-terminal domain-containing protein [Promethearchaeota archaeon]
MSEAYDNFMIYELDDSGEKIRIPATEEEFKVANGSNFLHPEQVLVIVKESLRRIYIWKGAKSPVRKRFISSRIAGALQEELVKNAAFHRCKIVSVDQGDEVEEFLNAFRFESMTVEEKLADMRYIRNIDREKMYDRGEIPDTEPKYVKIESKPEPHVSPALEELEKEKVVPLPKGSKEKAKKAIPISREPVRAAPKKVSPITKTSYAGTLSTTRQSTGLSEDQKKIIMEKIIKTDVPDGYKRQNLILGHTLYGAVLKKVNVLGKTMEETEWEQVTSLPKGTIEIDDRMLRVYFDDKGGIVEALEILEKVDDSTKDTKTSSSAESKSTAEKKSEKKEESEEDFDSMTVKELKVYADQHNIELASGARKAEIIEVIKDSLINAEKTSKRRNLPEIPKV